MKGAPYSTTTTAIGVCVSNQSRWILSRIHGCCRRSKPRRGLRIRFGAADVAGSRFSSSERCVDLNKGLGASLVRTKASITTSFCSQHYFPCNSRRPRRPLPKRERYTPSRNAMVETCKNKHPSRPPHLKAPSDSFLCGEVAVLTCNPTYLFCRRRN